MKTQCSTCRWFAVREVKKGFTGDCLRPLPVPDEAKAVRLRELVDKSLVGIRGTDGHNCAGWEKRAVGEKR